MFVKNRKNDIIQLYYKFLQQNLESLSQGSMEIIFSQKFSEISLKKVAAIIAPKKIDKNQLVLKRAIDLFFQIIPMEQFQAASQFQKLQNILISQQLFSTILTEVISKKTKKFILGIQSLKIKKQQILIDKQKRKCQGLNQNDLPKSLIEIKKTKIQFDLKIFQQALIKIRTACTRLQQLIFKMIEIHQWKCQVKNNCKQSYTQGHLFKGIFKKFIAANQNLRKEIYKSIHQSTNIPTQTIKNQIHKLARQIPAFQRQTFQSFQLDLFMQINEQEKYFICKNCLGSSKKDKDKKEKKKKKNGFVNNQVTPVEQKNTEDLQKSRKNSTVDFDQNSTLTNLSEQFDDQRKMQEQRHFDRVNNFLSDLKIDIEGRSQIRLNYFDQELQNQTLNLNFFQLKKNSIYTPPKFSSLKNKIDKILYKNQSSV